MARTDRANGGIGGLAKGIIVTGAKHFCLRIHLGMDLKTDDDFQCLHAVRIAFSFGFGIFDFLI